MNIGLVGKTGCGKSTLAKHIAAEFGHEIIDSDVLRTYINLRLEGWQIMQRHMEQGLQVPLDLFAKALSRKIIPLQDKELILDTMLSAEILFEYEKYTNRIDIAFHLDASDEVAAQRVLARNREPKILEHIENRKSRFLKEFPKLKQHLGSRLINIDAHQTPEEISAQVLEILGD